MIDPAHQLSITAQARLLGISRANVYYLPRATSPADLTLMRRIDELHLNFPFAGSRMLRDLLRLEGHNVGRKHVRTLMRKRASRRSTARRTRVSATPSTPSSRTCCGASRSIGRTRYGLWISPTCR